MAIKLDADLLTWIEEESNQVSTPYAAPVPVQLLVMRLALALRPDHEDLSRSIELALKTYEKAELLRVLRQLERKNWINFVNSKGTTIIMTDEQFNLGRGASAGINPTFVAITDKGVTQLQRMKLSAETVTPEE